MKILREQYTLGLRYFEGNRLIPRNNQMLIYFATYHSFLLTILSKEEFDWKTV